MKTATSQPNPGKHARLLKGIAGLQILLALVGYATSGETWTAASTMIALSLAMILFSRERVHDERVEQLKLKAISYGLFGGLLVLSLLNTGGRMLKGFSFRLSLSTFDGLSLVLVIALAFFHYWHWQDGRSQAD